MKPIMTSKRENRKMELMYLVKLYEFYEDNYDCLQSHDDFWKAVIEDQETNVGYLFYQMVEKEEN